MAGNSRLNTWRRVILIIVAVDLCVALIELGLAVANLGPSTRERLFIAAYLVAIALLALLIRWYVGWAVSRGQRRSH